MWIKSGNSSAVPYWKFTSFNNTLFLSEDGLFKCLEKFSDVFNNYIDFSDEISSIIFFPIKTFYWAYEGKPLVTSKNTFKDIKVNVPEGRSFTQIVARKFISKKYNNFADYKGYTYIKAFLPFLGYIDVDVNECMGKYLYVLLTIDVQSGMGTYMLGVSPSLIDYDVYNPYIKGVDLSTLRIFATYQTKIGIDIPIGRSNRGDIIRNNILGAVKTAASVATAVYTNSLPPTTTTQTTTTTYDIQGRGLYKGARMKQIMSGTETTTSTRTYSKAIDKSKPISEAINGSIDALNRTVPDGNVDRINDSNLLFSMSTNVHIVIYRPKIMNDSKNYKHLIGSPVGATYQLNRLSGYTELSSINIEGSDFELITSEEYDELESILLSSNGIILGGEIEHLDHFDLYDRETNSILETFYFPYGMTWEDFLNSEYNINRLFIGYGDSIKYNKEYYLHNYESDFVDIHDYVKNEPYFVNVYTSVPEDE